MALGMGSTSMSEARHGSVGSNYYSYRICLTDFSLVGLSAFNGKLRSSLVLLHLLTIMQRVAPR